MGSFNTFCAMTRQIITPGEEVYIVPLVRQQGSRSVVCIEKDGSEKITQEIASNVYNFDHYKPVGVMFTGDYADYGRCDLYQDPSNKLQYYAFKEYLSKHLYKVLQGENEYHEQAVDPVALDKLSMEEHWNTLADLFHSKRLFVRANTIFSSEPLSLTYMVVSKKYADIALKMYREQDPSFYVYNGDTSFNDYFKLSLKSRYKHFLRYLKKKDSLSELEDLTKYNSIQYFLNVSRDNGSYIPQRYFETVIKTLAKESETKEAGFQCFSSLVNLKDLVTFFQSVNLTPSPIWYASQDYSNISGFLYSIFMSIVHKDVLKEQHEIAYENSEEDSSKELTDHQLIKERLKIFTKDY